MFPVDPPTELRKKKKKKKGRLEHSFIVSYKNYFLLNPVYSSQEKYKMKKKKNLPSHLYLSVALEDTSESSTCCHPRADVVTSGD